MKVQGVIVLASVALGPVIAIQDAEAAHEIRYCSDSAENLEKQLRRIGWRDTGHVKHSVVIMPNSGGGASHLVTDEETSIVSGIGSTCSTVAPVAAQT